ncbi:MAG: DUF4957 domain-containing protein [Paludibacter sp.]
MKKTFTFLAAFCVLAISNVWATKIQVTTAAEFTTAWGTYASGDTIVLAAGDYDLSTNVTISKTVTIMADPNASTMPKIIKTQFIFGADCSFFVEGIEVYYDVEGVATPTGSYFIQAQSGGNWNIPTISIKNSNIHGYGRAMVRADNTTVIPTITNLIINNCIISDMGRNSAGYSVLALKTGKVSNVTITNSTVYNCMNGFWYSEKNDFPVIFNMDKCCILKSTSTGSKLIFNNNTNPGSVHTIKDCIISDSYDASADKMQIKLGSNGTDTYGHINNVILGNNMNASIFVSTTLTTDNEVAVTALSFNYPALTITTTPSTVSNIGDPRWEINGVRTNTDFKSFNNIFAYISNNQLTVGNLPLNSSVDIYSFSGSHIYSKSNSGSILQIPMSSACIVKVVSGTGIKCVKVIK